MSRRQNVLTSKNPALKRWRQNVSALKHLVGKTFQRQYISAQKVARQEVLRANCPYDEMYQRLSA